jgi:hypothetical protein
VEKSLKVFQEEHLLTLDNSQWNYYYHRHPIIEQQQQLRSCVKESF